MKLLILLSILPFSNLSNHTNFKKKDNRLIENTNIRFDSIDFTRLELKFTQVGCYNHDSYKINFQKVDSGYILNFYGYSTNDCEKLKQHLENDDKLLKSKFFKNSEINIVKDVLTSEDFIYSTMNNSINIIYEGKEYKFYNNCPYPKWQIFIIEQISKK